MSRVGRRFKLFMMVLIVGTILLPFVFRALPGSDSTASEPGCFEGSVEIFEDLYGPALSVERLKIEAACEGSSTRLGPAALTELRVQP